MHDNFSSRIVKAGLTVSFGSIATGVLKPSRLSGILHFCLDIQKSDVMISDEEPRQWTEISAPPHLEPRPALICLGETSVHQELSVLALIRGKDRYVFVYDDESREELIEAIRAQAASPAVSLSWYDAAVLTDRARQQAAEAAKAKVSMKNL